MVVGDDEKTQIQKGSPFATHIIQSFFCCFIVVDTVLNGKLIAPGSLTQRRHEALCLYTVSLPKKLKHWPLNPRTLLLQIALEQRRGFKRLHPQVDGP